MFAGSVDDGKSTLLGRLLIDSDRVKKDVLANIIKSSHKEGDVFDYSLVADGLKSERQQGITIDVAHLYTDIDGIRMHILDCPGHVEYTKNMAVAASTADIAILLVDASKGPTEQTRRHISILKFLRVPRIITALNKADLLNYDREKLKKLSEGLPQPCIPISAKTGWNVFHPEAWQKQTLVGAIKDCLKTPITQAEEKPTTVFHIFSVYPAEPKRLYTGRCKQGKLHVGDTMVITRTNETVVIDSAANWGDRAAITLRGEYDLERGDSLISKQDIRCASALDAQVLWFAKTPMQLNAPYIAQGSDYGHRNVVFESIRYKINMIDSYRYEDKENLKANENGYVHCEFDSPVIQPSTYILIDKKTYETVGCLITHGESTFV